jgi:hypothetical protein
MSHTVSLALFLLKLHHQLFQLTPVALILSQDGQLLAEFCMLLNDDPGLVLELSPLFAQSLDLLPHEGRAQLLLVLCLFDFHLAKLKLSLNDHMLRVLVDLSLRCIQVAVRRRPKDGKFQL